MSNEKKSVKYVLLARDTLSKGLGGKSHTEGIMEALTGYTKISCVGKDVHVLNDHYPDIILNNINSPFYYAKLFFNVLKDKDTNCFLYRKTIVGLYITCFCILIKKLLLHKQLHIAEYNAISGDYRLNNKFLKKILVFVNSFPLMFFDGVYCVNNNIKKRILSSRLVAEHKTFICSNGGLSKKPFVVRTSSKIKYNATIQIFFYGSNQEQYHLSRFISTLHSINHSSNKLIFLNLVGPGLEVFSDVYVNYYNPMNLDEFSSTVHKIGGRCWGLIPLDSLGCYNDIYPIKTFDYMYSDLPIIHSSCSLHGLDKESRYTVSYDFNNDESLKNALLKIRDMSLDEYIKCVESVVAAYPQYTWKSTLAELRKKITG